jgi:glycosyltransferase involved in cell wall biosynthesis/SAM-dependent methyltransferase
MEKNMQNREQLIVFTICSRNFTAYAKTLFESLKLHHPDAEFYLFLCDEVDSGYDITSLPFKVVTLAELDIPNVREMAERYNITEFNTAIKPYAFSHLFKKLAVDRVLYLDPDILILSPLQEVVNAFADGSECVLTPHILEPAENVEMSDIRILQFGIYNLGFLGLRNTPDVVRIVQWWERQLVEGCVIDLARGLFVDQKWADLFPAFLKRTTVLHHPGYNVAYWNLSQRKIERIDGLWYSNRQPLRFVHFSGNKLDDPIFFSRHSGVQTRDNIGDLKHLLDLYHERINANGHADYSKLSYSFGWNGVSGVNLHTPEPGTAPSPQNESPPLTRRLTGRIRSYVKLVRTAAQMSGGWLALVYKFLRTLKRGGPAAFRQRTHLVRSYMDAMPASKAPAPQPPSGQTPQWTPRLLFIDWSTPRPDRDAGSLSAFQILKIYINLGYDVTFIPSDLKYLGDYTEAVRSLGVRCLHKEDIGTLRDHLKKSGKSYDFIMLCRAPVAAHYLADIRKFAPQAKVLLNTVDLHFLRENREAEIDGAQEKIEAARRSKEWELDIISKCDVTIVLNPVEKEILQRELPNADIRTIPLIFVEAEYEYPAFEARRDILFIGSFLHSPNTDAVLYFHRDVLPLVRKVIPDIKFHVIGNAPPPEVTALHNGSGTVIHGHVKDISMMFHACKLSVAPLRFGAGIKGKIATSLAYGLPVVATSLAAEGMEIEAGRHVLVADDAQQFADAVVSAYTSEDLWNRLSRNGHDRVLESFSAMTGHRLISRFMKDINPGHKQLDCYTLRSHEEYELLRKAISSDLSTRRSVELALIRHDQPSFFVDGFCAVCGSESKFNTGMMYSYETTEDGKPIPNWREHLACVQCGFTNRLRASMHFLYQRVRPVANASIYITEQTTQLYKWLKTRHPKLVGSEYFGDEIPFGAKKNGIRNEDLTALTFADNSFDCILSFDVMEHVSDDLSALAEVHRCLKPGGTFLFTAPFAKDRTEKMVRARVLSDGSIEHILPPEYHGNPIDTENGSLCFRYFAWDLISDLKSIGFDDVSILTYWSRDFAYLGVEQFLFIAKKGMGVK